LPNDFVGVSQTHECGLELRWREVNAFVKHGVKELAVTLSIALVCALPIHHRLTRKETGPHRTHAVRHRRNTGFLRRGFKSFA
jgi:hypothetical protein